jgi:hypothetical protein
MPAKLNWASSALVRRRMWVRLPPLAFPTRCQGRTARRSSAKREKRVRLPGASLQPRPTVRAYKPEQVLCDAGATCAAVIPLSCPVAQWWCGRLLTGWVQVRVLPGQLQRKGEPTGTMAPAWKAGEAKALAGSSPVPSTFSSRGRAARRPSDTWVEVGSTPAGWTIGAGRPSLKRKRGREGNAALADASSSDRRLSANSMSARLLLVKFAFEVSTPTRI